MKLTLSSLTNLSSSTAVQVLNDNFNKIVTAWENTFSRDGTSPNKVAATVDMDSFRMINLPAPLTNSEPLRLGDVGGILPSNIANAATYAITAQTAANSAAASATAAASYVGAATSAPKWSTGRTITLTGDITGTSPAWDGTGNLAFSGTLIAAGAVTGAKMAVNAAITNIGYTPVNRSGDTFAGEMLVANVAPTDPLSVGFRGIPVNAQDVTYTFVLTDSGKMIRHTSGSAHTYTLPPESSVNYALGTTIVVRNVGAGTLTVTRGAGVTLYKPGTVTNGDISVAQGGLATLIKEASDTWTVIGTKVS